MSPFLQNFLAWAAQVAFLALAGGLAALTVRHARTRLYLWQGILAIALLLPFLEPVKQPPPIGVSAATTTELVAAVHRTTLVSPHFTLSTKDYLLGAIAVGAMIRFLLLGAGLLRLRGIRRTANSMSVPPLAFASEARWYVSENIASPVTFGWLKPCIVLPASIEELPASAREAIAQHELIHLYRRDWLFVMGEEIVRGILWFHPAIWFVLSRIHLAREQAVDQEVVEATRDRAGYLDALVAVAARMSGPDVAPAPLFLKKRQLSARVAALLKETSMSRTRLIAGTSASVSVVAAGLIGALWLFSLKTAAQVLPDDSGIIVDAGGRLLHRAPVHTFAPAVQGEVVVQATLNRQGEVSDARVMSGPDELRKYALESVLQWHYDSTQLSPVQIRIHFGQGPPSNPTLARPVASQQSPAPPPLPPSSPANPANIAGAEGGQGNIALFLKDPKFYNQTVLQTTGTRIVRHINFSGLSPELEQAIRNRLPAPEGQIRYSELRATLREVDEHLTTIWRTMQLAADPSQAVIPDYIDNVTVYLDGQAPAVATPASPVASDGPPVIAEDVAKRALIEMAPTAYPPLAKVARVQGAIKLMATVGTDGTVQNVEFISGNAMLASAAVDSVKQWVFQPFLLNGQVAVVRIPVTVNFVLQ